MANDENLKPQNKRPKSEQREIARQGGIASGKARRRKRTMKEAAKLILSLPANGEQAVLLAQYGIEEKDRTNITLIIAKAVQMAANGNIKAAEFVRDIIGESPKMQLLEKRLEALAEEKEATHLLSDEWVDAISNIEEE
mgnify:CR=1 FL=1